MSALTLGSIVAEIAEIRAELRRQGATKTVIDQATENVVRDRWPFTREWKYLCAGCDDTGLLLTHERTRLHGATLIWVGRACTCSQGARYHDKPRSEQDFTQAGKTPKPSGFSRWGR